MPFPESQPTVINGVEVAVADEGLPTQHWKPVDNSTFDPNRGYEWVHEDYLRLEPTAPEHAGVNFRNVAPLTPETLPSGENRLEYAEKSYFFDHRLNNHITVSLGSFSTAPNKEGRREVSRGVARSLVQNGQAIDSFFSTVDGINEALTTTDPLDPLGLGRHIKDYTEMVMSALPEAAKSGGEKYLQDIERLEKRISALTQDILSNPQWLSNEVHEQRLLVLTLQHKLDETRIGFSRRIGSFFQQSAHEGGVRGVSAKLVLQGLLRSAKNPQQVVEMLSAASIFGLDHEDDVVLTEHIADTAAGENDIGSSHIRSRLGRTAVDTDNPPLMSQYVALHYAINRFYRHNKMKETRYISWLEGVVLEEGKVQADSINPPDTETILTPSTIYDAGATQDLSEEQHLAALRPRLKGRIRALQSLLRLRFQHATHKEYEVAYPNLSFVTYGLPGLGESYVYTEKRDRSHIPGDDRTELEVLRDEMVSRLALETPIRQVPVHDGLSTNTLLELVRPLRLSADAYQRGEALISKLAREVTDPEKALPLSPYGDREKINNNNHGSLSLPGLKEFVFRPEEDGRTSVTIGIGNFTLLVFLDEHLDLVTAAGDDIPISNEAKTWWKALILVHLKRAVLPINHVSGGSEVPRTHTDGERTRVARIGHWYHLPVGARPDPQHAAEIKRLWPKIDIVRENKIRERDGQTQGTRYFNYRKPVGLDIRRPSPVDPAGAMAELEEAILQKL